MSVRKYLKYIKTQVIKTVKKCRFFHTNILYFHHLPDNLHEGSFSSQRDDPEVELTMVCLEIQCIRFSLLAVSPSQKKFSQKAWTTSRMESETKCAGSSKNEEAQEIRCSLKQNCCYMSVTKPSWENAIQISFIIFLIVRYTASLENKPWHDRRHRDRLWWTGVTSLCR